MPKKFDTNPLDPEFPQRVTEAQHQAETTPNLDARTQAFVQTPVMEEPTRRYDNPPNFTPYSQPPPADFDGQNVPQAYQTARLNADVENSSARKVQSVGLPENVLTALPYIPFYIGLVTGILVLLFVPKSEAKVRFHAAQGLAAHLAILIVTAILSAVGNISHLANIGNTIFQIVATIMLIIFAIKAWQGKPVHIEAVDDLTEWLEEKIQPRK